MAVQVPERVHAWIGVLTVFGLGGGLLVVHLLHALTEGEDMVTFTYGILIPMLFSVGLLVGGVGLWWADYSGPHKLRIGTWSVVGAIALASAAGLIVLYEAAEGVVVSDAPFVIAGQASIGGMAGGVVGVYDVRQRRARSHAERLSNQLSVLNRVLRHDIRNEVNVIHGLVDGLRDEIDDSDRIETIQRKAVNLVTLSDQAREIEALARRDEAPLEVIDLVPILQEECDRLTSRYPNVSIDRSIPTDAFVVAHPLIDSALQNLLRNAVEHNEAAAPRLTIDCERVTDGDGGHVVARIADNGPGIPQEEVDVLEQGYETPLEHTSGFGLWLVNWIVHRSDGDILFEENDPTGSTVCIRLTAAN